MFLQDSGWQRVKERDMKLCFLHSYFALTLSLTSSCYAIVSLAALWTCVSCVVSRPECSPSATGRLEDNTVTGRGSPLASQTPATLPTLRPRACAGGIMRGRRGGEAWTLNYSSITVSLEPREKNESTKPTDIYKCSVLKPS